MLVVLALLSLTLLIGTAASLYQAVRATVAERLAEARLGEVERQQNVVAGRRRTLPIRSEELRKGISASHSIR